MHSLKIRNPPRRNAERRLNVAWIDDISIGTHVVGLLINAEQQGRYLGDLFQIVEACVIRHFGKTVCIRDDSELSSSKFARTQDRDAAGNGFPMELKVTSPHVSPQPIALRGVDGREIDDRDVSVSEL